MFILFKKKEKKQIKHQETDELSAYFADSALTRHIHTTEICDMGPLRKRKMCVHVEKKWKYCFEGGKVEMWKCCFKPNNCHSSSLKCLG